MALKCFDVITLSPPKMEEDYSESTADFILRDPAVCDSKIKVTVSLIWQKKPNFIRILLNSSNDHSTGFSLHMKFLNPNGHVLSSCISYPKYPQSEQGNLSGLDRYPNFYVEKRFPNPSGQNEHSLLTDYLVPLRSGFLFNTMHEDSRTTNDPFFKVEMSVIDITPRL